MLDTAQGVLQHLYHLFTEEQFTLVHHGPWILNSLFVGFIVYLLLKPSYKKSKDDKLSEKEVDALCNEWEPEPLLPAAAATDASKWFQSNCNGPVIEGFRNSKLIIDGAECKDFASFNFLGLSGRKDMEELALKTVEKYGVGSCGPRGFYGTIDVHLELEERISKFMSVEETILYSYGFATIASVIPCYAKRGDLILCDKGISTGPQTGVYLSRSNVKWFDHNNMEQLESLMKAAVDSDKKAGLETPVQRRFVVVEGVYATTGQVAKLDEIVRLKNKYKFRLVLDDSYGFGTMGANGKGTLEHFGLPVSEATLLSVSMGNALGSIGGFCVGSHSVVDAQRLSGLGYCFSASLPPVFAVVAHRALDLLEEAPNMFKEVQHNAKILREELKKSKKLDISSGNNSPIVLVSPRNPSAKRADDEAKLQSVVDELRTKHSAVITRVKDADARLTGHPEPLFGACIRIPASAAFTAEETRAVAKAIASIADRVL